MGRGIESIKKADRIRKGAKRYKMDKEEYAFWEENGFPLTYRWNGVPIHREKKQRTTLKPNNPTKAPKSKTQAGVVEISSEPEESDTDCSDKGNNNYTEDMEPKTLPTTTGKTASSHLNSLTPKIPSGQSKQAGKPGKNPQGKAKKLKSSNNPQPTSAFPISPIFRLSDPLPVPDLSNEAEADDEGDKTDDGLKDKPKMKTKKDAKKRGNKETAQDSDADSDAPEIDKLPHEKQHYELRSRRYRLSKYGPYKHDTWMHSGDEAIYAQAGPKSISVDRWDGITLDHLEEIYVTMPESQLRFTPEDEGYSPPTIENLFRPTRLLEPGSWPSLPEISRSGSRSLHLRAPGRRNGFRDALPNRPDGNLEAIRRLDSFDSVLSTRLPMSPRLLPLLRNPPYDLDSRPYPSSCPATSQLRLFLERPPHSG